MATITCEYKSVNPSKVLNVVVDVSKKKLDTRYVLRPDPQSAVIHQDLVLNRTGDIRRYLRVCIEVAQRNGMNKIRVVFEPTANYHLKLSRTAHSLNQFTALVNGEAVSKLRVVESNDTGKTDIKDPRIMQMLVDLDKTLTDRELPDRYLQLRKLNAIYEDHEVDAGRVRCRLHFAVLDLYCDYSSGKGFLYSNTGQALVEEYGCNPYRIFEHGYKQFSKTMRKAAPRVKTATLERLFEDAKQSTYNELSDDYAAVLEMQIKHLMNQYKFHVQRKQEVRGQMEQLSREQREEDPQIPEPKKGVITEFALARLLGETGPLDQFSSCSKLMRYAGLNVRQRQSGDYKGQDKISKKGRSLLRKIIHQIVLPLVKRGALFGQFHHDKKEKDKMPGTKSMTVVARKFLKMFFGWYQSGKTFDPKRVFICEGEYKAA